ncbi:MAG: amidohydrolase [Dermatophilaceae bacterium]
MTATAGERYLADVIRSAAARTAVPTKPQHDGGPEDLRKRIVAHVDDHIGELAALANQLHATPETALEEHESVAAVQAVLAAHGVTVELGMAGLSTALRASVGGDGPRIAVIAEYDALPGLGHACGHNLICAAAVGAFLAAHEVVADVGGSVTLLGTPGEEGYGGKELLARAGVVDDLDAVVMVHPAGFDMARHTWIGARSASVVITGRAAHASATPFLGRNALDGLVLTYQGVSMLRQHILPDDRVHMIITDGGETPGVIPARAAGRVAVRSGTGEGLRDLSDRVEAAVRAAAVATGTEASLEWDERPAYLPMRNNGPLSDRYAVNAEGLGRRLTAPGAVPANLSASTDLGNVSVRVPAIQPLIRVAPPHVAMHSTEFASYTTGDGARAAVRDGAVALALTMIDFLADPALRADVAADFAGRGGATTASAILEAGGADA